MPAGLLPAAILAAGPAGYWRLDEGAGSVARDSSGNGRDGTYDGGVVLGDVAGPYGAYPDFAQSGDGVVIPDDFDWTPSGPSPVTVVGLLSSTHPIGSVTSLAIARKVDEWQAARSSVDSAIAVTSRTTPVLSYWLTEASGSVLATVDGVWYLVIMELPFGAAPVVYVDGTGPLGSSFGPSGTQNGNQTTSLVLGQTSTTTGTGRHLAHVAVFKKALSSGERADIVAAAIADGWI